MWYTTEHARRDALKQAEAKKRSLDKPTGLLDKPRSLLDKTGHVTGLSKRQA